MVEKEISNNFDNDYIKWVDELKTRYQKSQIKAAISVNKELIRFNYLLGKDIVEISKNKKWGDKFLEKLSKDLKKYFPKSSCFSSRNLSYMKQFYLLFPHNNELFNDENVIVPQVGAKILNLPWGHVKLIVDKFKNYLFL